MMRRIESVTARSSFAIARQLAFLVGDQPLYPLLQLVRQTAKLRGILLCQCREALFRGRKLAQEALPSYPVKEARAIPEVRDHGPQLCQGEGSREVVLVIAGLIVGQL